MNSSASPAPLAAATDVPSLPFAAKFSVIGFASAGGHLPYACHVFVPRSKIHASGLEEAFLPLRCRAKNGASTLSRYQSEVFAPNSISPSLSPSFRAQPPWLHGPITRT